MRHAASYLLAVACLACPSLLYAQTAADEKSRAEFAISDPSLTTDISAGRPQFTLLSDSDNTTAAGEIGVDWSDVTRLFLRMEAPLQKDGDTTFADLDGLRGGTQASAGLTHYFLRIKNESAILGVCEAFNKENRNKPLDLDIAAGKCTLKNIDESESDKDDNISTEARLSIAHAFAEVCLEREAQGKGRLAGKACTLDNLKAAGEPWATKAAEAEKKALDGVCKAYNVVTDPINIAAGQCTSQRLRAGGTFWEKRAMVAAAVRPTIILTLKGSVQNNRFKFAEPPSLERKTFSRNSSALRAGLGMLFDPHVFGGASYRYEHSFEGASPTQVCSPIPDTTSLSCGSLALKPPSREDHHVVQAEFRLFPTDWLGLNPKVSHDFKNGGVTGYQLLAYFLTSEKAGLNGGVDLGYRSDEKKLGIRVFIGATFGVLP
jgi:hypothetical protein